MFSLHGSVIPKAVCVAWPGAVIAVVLSWLLYDEDLPSSFSRLGKTVSSFVTIVGLLEVFRTTVAYERFWAGANLLRTIRVQWFNCASCLVAFCSCSPSRREEVELFRHQLVRLVSLLFAAAALQAAGDQTGFEVVDIYGLDPRPLKFMTQHSERCEVIMQWLQKLIVEEARSGVLDLHPAILSRVFQELANGYVNVHTIRGITEVPFPFPYAQLMSVSLLGTTVLWPLVTAYVLRTPYLAGILAFVVVAAFWSINYIAMEIESPFGDDINDLPVKDMVAGMNSSLMNLLDERTSTPPPVWADLMVDLDTRVMWSGGTSCRDCYKPVVCPHTFSMPEGRGAIFLRALLRGLSSQIKFGVEEIFGPAKRPACGDRELPLGTDLMTAAPPCSWE